MGGFGGALTAALDVMAFTHDVDINGAAQGLNLSNNPKPNVTTAQQNKQVLRYYKNIKICILMIILFVILCF